MCLLNKKRRTADWIFVAAKCCAAIGLDQGLWIIFYIIERNKNQYSRYKKDENYLPSGLKSTSSNSRVVAFCDVGVWHWMVGLVATSWTQGCWGRCPSPFGYGVRGQSQPFTATIVAVTFIAAFNCSQHTAATGRKWLSRHRLVRPTEACSSKLSTRCSGLGMRVGSCSSTAVVRAASTRTAAHAAPLSPLSYFAQPQNRHSKSHSVSWSSFAGCLSSFDSAAFAGWPFAVGVGGHHYCRLDCSQLGLELTLGEIRTLYKIDY